MTQKAAKVAKPAFDITVRVIDKAGAKHQANMNISAANLATALKGADIEARKMFPKAQSVVAFEKGNPPAKAAAKTSTKAIAVPKQRAIFGPDQCHQRDAKGQPSCDQTRQKGRNLCPTHEKVWQAAARKRRAERLATGTPAPNAPKGVNSAGTSKATVKATKATRSQTKGRATTPRRDPIDHGQSAAKPHPMTVLRQPVQRQPSPVAAKVASAR